MSDKPNDQAPIVPAEQKKIDFYGDELIAVRDEEGTVWVPVRHICERLGVDWGSQRRRILNDPVLSEEMRFVVLTPRTKGGRSSVQALPVKYIRFWLAQINASRVREDLVPVVIRYQREVADIIDRAFARPLTVPPPVGADKAHIVAMRDLTRRQAEIAERQAELARQQAEIWDTVLAEIAQRETESRRLDAVQQLAEDHEIMFGDVFEELERVRQEQARLREEQARVQEDVARLQQTEADQLRLLLPPAEAEITPEQQATIQGLIQDLVAAANARGIALWQNRGGNNYQAAYATLNRTFRVPSYKNLTQAQFPKAVEWLQREIAKVEEG